MFNAKGLTLLCLAIAMLCTTTQTTRAVLIYFEDIPLGTTYEVGDTFIASGVTIEIRGVVTWCWRNGQLETTPGCLKKTGT